MNKCVPLISGFKNQPKNRGKALDKKNKSALLKKNRWSSRFMFDLFLNPEPNAKFILPTGYLDKA